MPADSVEFGTRQTMIPSPPWVNRSQSRWQRAPFSLHPAIAPVYFRGTQFGGLLDLTISLCYKRRSTVIVNATNIYESTSASPSLLTARGCGGELLWIRA